MVRVALLNCEDIPSWRGVYEKQFASFFQLEPTDVLVSYCVPLGELPTPFALRESFDALVISGSHYDAHNESLDWVIPLVSLVKEVILTEDSNFLCFGMCFGHQIIGTALGLTPSFLPDAAIEYGAVLCTLNERFAGLLGIGSNELLLWETHGSCIRLDSEPTTAALQRRWCTGNSPYTEVEGLAYGNRVLSLQGHPEFTCEIVKGIGDSLVREGLLAPEVLKVKNIEMDQSLLLVERTRKIFSDFFSKVLRRAIILDWLEQPHSA